MRQFFPGAAALALTVAVAASCRTGVDTSSPDAPPAGDVHAQAAAFFAGQPRYFRPLAHTAPPEGLDAMDSATCGACHEDQRAEWRDSIHARAWDDDQYQAELAKDPSIQWICINCHLPLYDQQAQLPIGLLDGDLRQPTMVENPGYRETLRDDAIGCAACHVRDGWIEGPSGSSPDAPHRTRRGDGLLEPAFCIRCHGVEVYIDQLDLVCAFATAREWESWIAARPEGGERRCQDCHMPAVEHRRWIGSAPATGRHHAFPGSLIPKRPADAAAFDALRQVFPEGLALQVSLDPAAPRRGADAVARIDLTNAVAGHSVPTGDPERYLELRTRITGGDGSLLAEHSEVIKARYEWHPEPRLLSDNRLEPGERREIRIPFPVGRSETVRVEVELHKFRIDDHALAYHHLEDRIVPGRLALTAEAAASTVP